MCAFIVDSVDLQKLTPRKKRNLKRELQRRKNALQAKIKHNQATVRDLDKAINKREKWPPGGIDKARAIRDRSAAPARRGDFSRSRRPFRAGWPKQHPGAGRLCTHADIGAAI